jgi:adenylate cyclase
LLDDDTLAQRPDETWPPSHQLHGDILEALLSYKPAAVPPRPRPCAGPISGQGADRAGDCNPHHRPRSHQKPNFALARAQLALLSSLAQNTGLIEPSTEHTQEALAAAEMAIAADAGSSEVLGYAGCALSDLGHTKRGVEILRQAVEIDPSNAQAEVALGAALAVLGDLDAGIARMRHGIKLSPRDRRLGFWGWALGTFLLRANRTGEALEEALIAARRDPRLYLPPILEAVAQATLGRAELARAALISARRIRPKLTKHEIERSHGRRAARTLLDVWDAN